MDHPWFKESSNSSHQNNPKRNYYVWESGRGSNALQPPNNWVSLLGGEGGEKKNNEDENGSTGDDDEEEDDDDDAMFLTYIRKRNRDFMMYLTRELDALPDSAKTLKLAFSRKLFN